jgi:hypothetical protein
VGSKKWRKKYNVWRKTDGPEVNKYTRKRKMESRSRQEPKARNTMAQCYNREESKKGNLLIKYDFVN